jgi:crossover junction endodeoxyribonuclease RusA
MAKQKTFEIVIDEIPPSVNHCYVITRSHKKVLTRTAKDFIQYVRDLTAIKFRKERLTMYSDKKFFKMEIEFVFPNLRFPDPNNLLKVLIDAFEGVVFENDKWCLPSITSAKVQKGVAKTIVRFIF